MSPARSGPAYALISAGGSLVCALLILAAWFFYMHAFPAAPIEASDTAGYMSAAKDLVDGRMDALQERTPGYPLLMVATGSAYELKRSLFLASLALHLAAVGMLIAMLRAVGLKSSALVISTVVALQPALAQSASWALSEVVAEFCLMAGTVAIYLHLKGGRMRWAILAGVAFGYAALTRPSYALVGVTVVLALEWIRFASRDSSQRIRTRLARSAIVAGIPIAVMGAYALFNAARHDFPGVSPRIGSSLAVRITNLYEFIPDSGVRTILLRARANDHLTGANPSWAFYHAQDELLSHTGMSQYQLYQSMVPLSLGVIARHPQAYLEEVIVSFAAFWFPNSSTESLVQGARGKLAEYAAHYAVTGLFFLVVGAIGSLSALAVISRGSFRMIVSTKLSIVAVAAAIVLYNAFITCALDSAEARYREPTDLLVVLVAIAGVSWFRDWRTVSPAA